MNVEAFFASALNEKLDYAFQEPEYYYINNDEYDILVTEESKMEFFKLFALNLVETLCEISNNGTLV